MPVDSKAHRVRSTLDAIVEHCVDYSARNFTKWSFVMSLNFETLSCQWFGVKRIKCIFADKGNSLIRFGYPVITSILILNHKAHISRNLIPDSIFILFVTFLAHFLNGPLQQIKKQFTVTFKFRNERLSNYYLQNTNVTI